ncbi:hypothetical protein MTAT_26090 [Moorella thermoacetica]|uniref:TrbC/VIRB2 family protein n=1 Tax=Neomoorella thermoacetica TaxID=1525 RepID=A0AAC9HG71_NEOTH|nr:hypothetical protein [Moorella thermoacetica]AOQ23088.1 hypothetical protein Maut_00625 [Moorella thermoacetica]TYL08945.1 hypothetical protein MTAT_26090 [Moorella thermoacetica]
MLKRLSNLGATALLFALTAVPAYAAGSFDVRTALNNTINAVRIAFVLVLLAAAIYKFFRHALVQAILLVVVGGLVYAALDQNGSVLSSIGNGLLRLLGI